MNGSDTGDWDLNDDEGELQNGASFSDVAPLQESMYYLWLDSTDVHDFLLIQDSDDLDFRNENVGVSAWIYPIVLSDVQYLVNKGDQYTTPKTTNYSLRILNDKLEFLIRDAQDRAQKVSSRFSIPENQWSFVAAFYDFDASRVYMWNDATSDPADTLEFDQEILTNDAPLAIGSWFRSDTSSWNDFQGRIDDVRISGRVQDIVPDMTTSIAPPLHNIPIHYALYPNYPNPFNSSTAITFDLPEPARVSLTVYNSMGQMIRRLADNELGSGQHVTVFDATSLSSGIYFLQMRTVRFAETKTMLLIR